MPDIVPGNLVGAYGAPARDFGCQVLNEMPCAISVLPRALRGISAASLPLKVTMKFSSFAAPFALAALCSTPLHTYAQNARDEIPAPAVTVPPANAAGHMATHTAFTGHYGRTSVAGVSIANLNRVEATRRLNRELASRLDAPVALTDGRLYFKRRRRDFGIELNLGQMLARAERGATFVPLGLRADHERLTAILRRIAPEFALEARPALPVLFKGHVQIRKESPWQRLNIGASVPRIDAQIQQNPAAHVLRLTVQRNLPAVTAADLKGIDAVIGSFTTRFNPGLVGRTTNMRTAIAKIDGTVVPKGAVFSLNKAVGERTAERGYQEAIIFENGKEKKGLGGGVSQVTGTLFNAALLAGLPIVTYRTHSRPVAYLPIGRDATVAWGQFDNKWRNNTAAAIYISYKIHGRHATAMLFGKGPASQTSLNVVARTLGEREKKAQLFRIVRKSGKIVSTERVGTSHYKWQKDDPID